MGAKQGMSVGHLAIHGVKWETADGGRAEGTGALGQLPSPATPLSPPM